MIKFGCHGSTWQLDYDVESDRMPEILDAINKAGFKGIDAQVKLLGRFQNQPLAFKEELQNRGLELAALTFPFSWETKEIKKRELELAEYYIDYLQYFPGAKLNIAPRVHAERKNVDENHQKIIILANEIGELAKEKKILASFHPSSPPGSYFRNSQDYQYMFDNLNFDTLSYTPDAGHIAFSDINVLEIFKNNLHRIKHVHFKDASLNNEWKKMGDGDIDFPAIVSLLQDNGYDGWIMVEEETKQSEMNPNQAIMDIGQYVEKNLIPEVKNNV
ncbi:sugar phosphate isomerase/epimerase family protein [Oceanobacillus locisalsi]|uniref:Sugar phosphate isomerase/epimerase family protein n=1 Tax=Oceanobacillus locisalsi TaxID=546107 RepID=A0ABW3NF24_9BACI